MKTAARIGGVALAIAVALASARASQSQTDDLDVLKAIPENYWSEAGLHQVRNVGKAESHTIRIELKH